jgi:hypothetical protein
MRMPGKSCATRPNCLHRPRYIPSVIDYALALLPGQLNLQLTPHGYHIGRKGEKRLSRNAPRVHLRVRLSMN